jgi:hypothetical protein
MKIFITFILSAFLIVSIAAAEETGHRFSGKKAERTYSYNYDYDYDIDFDDINFDDIDFKDFNFDFDDDHGVTVIDKTNRFDRHFSRNRYFGHSILEDADLSFRGSTIVIKHDRRGDVVKITGNYDLIINGGEVKLDDNQRRLVGEFYEQTHQLTEQAKLVGKEGAKIGIKGAKLGVSAFFKVFHLLSPNYDTDDLEREVEAEARLIEAQAKDLERYAKDIEYMADNIEDLAEQMSEEIPEIDRLGWF